MSLGNKEFDHYRILQLIGKGGMGEVYVIEDLWIKRRVAVKFIYLDRMQSEEVATNQALRLFWREATAIAQLDHPTIVPLYDHGEAVIDGVPVAYLIMPYYPEGSLVTWLHKRVQTWKTQKLTLKQVTHILLQAAEALQYTHTHQIIHRDVKPSNFLIRSQTESDEYPTLLLADFSIARLADMTSSVSQNVRGTPAYMAPEQWKGAAVFASDQYALAVMTYELLTGQTPFRGSPMQMMYAHLYESPQPLRALNPRLPAALDMVLATALAKNPQERFFSIRAFANAFWGAVQNIDERATLRAITAPLQAPPSIDCGDIRVKLAMRADEAQFGTTRMLAMPSGRIVQIQIPPGSKNGQVLRLAEQVQANDSSNAVGDLYLTLSIQEGEAEPTPSSISQTALEDSHRPIVVTEPSKSTTLPPAVPSYSSTLSDIDLPVENMALKPEGIPLDRITPVSELTPAQRLRAEQRVRSRRLFVLGLAGLVLTVGAGGVMLLTHSPASQQSASRSSSVTPIPKQTTATNTPTSTPTPTSSPLSSIGTTVVFYRGHTKKIRVLAWSPNSQRIASGSDDYTVQVWDALTGNNTLIYRGHSSYTEGAAWSPDGTRLASGSADTTVQIWNASNGTTLYTYRGHSLWVNRIAWSPDGKYIASGEQSGNPGQRVQAQVWEADTGNTLTFYRGHTDGIFAIGWSPDSTRVATCGYDGTLQVWEARSGKLLAKYMQGNGGDSNSLFGLAWSPDGQQIAVGSINNAAIVLNAQTGMSGSFYPVASSALDVAWSPDGARLAVATAQTATQVFDVKSGESLFTYNGQSGAIEAVGWSLDRHFIATGNDVGDAPGTVQVWESGL